MVSLAKISENSKLELERALKLLTETDVEKYMSDTSEVIKGAASMLKGYDESEIAIMLRDAKRREEYDRGRELEIAEEQGAEKAKIESIRTMSKNGASNEMIAKLLDLDISYVNEILK